MMILDQADPFVRTDKGLLCPDAGEAIDCNPGIDNALLLMPSLSF